MSPFSFSFSGHSLTGGGDDEVKKRLLLKTAVDAAEVDTQFATVYFSSLV